MTFVSFCINSNFLCHIIVYTCILNTASLFEESFFYFSFIRNKICLRLHNLKKYCYSLYSLFVCFGFANLNKTFFVVEFLLGFEFWLDCLSQSLYLSVKFMIKKVKKKNLQHFPLAFSFHSPYTNFIKHTG